MKTGSDPEPSGAEVDERPPTSELWTVPWKNVGYQEGLRGLGTVVAPLLIGFSLAAIATIATSATVPRLGSWAILAFACDVALLLFSMQVTIITLERGSSPERYLDWYPEATVDEQALAYLRERQAADFVAMIRLGHFARTAYDFGLTAFLAGLLLLLVPEDWSTPRIVAFVVTGIIVLAEAYWALANLSPIRLPHPQHLLEGRSPSNPLAKLRLSPFDQLDTASRTALKK